MIYASLSLCSNKSQNLFKTKVLSIGSIEFISSLALAIILLTAYIPGSLLIPTAALLGVTASLDVALLLCHFCTSSLKPQKHSSEFIPPSIHRKSKAQTLTPCPPTRRELTSEEIKLIDEKFKIHSLFPQSEEEGYDLFKNLLLNILHTEKSCFFEKIYFALHSSQGIGLMLNGSDGMLSHYVQKVDAAQGPQLIIVSSDRNSIAYAGVPEYVKSRVTDRGGYYLVLSKADADCDPFPNWLKELIIHGRAPGEFLEEPKLYDTKYCEIDSGSTIFKA